jgi:crotonobetainyl-CoA:carnitine CoA-transferase CaiB-like acyl-CoA transferase
MTTDSATPAGTGGALAGIRVLEIGQFLSAPRCARILAEQGADVIKVEPPTGDPLRLLMTLSGAERALSVVNGNKRSVVLNLKKASAQRALRALVKEVDVVVENNAPGMLAKVGLAPEVLRAENERLITASISGFGGTGPLKERVAFDIIAQATSGIMDGLGLGDRPPAIFFADLVSGGYAAMAIGFALFARERTGRGQHLDISMQEVMYAHHFNAHTHRALSDEDEAHVVERLGRSLDHIITSSESPLPFWNAYLATDGRVAVVALTDAQWQRLMVAIGRDELVGDPRFETFAHRVRHAAEGLEVVEAWTRGKSSEEIVDALAAVGIPCGKVKSRDEVNEDPQLEARGMMQTARHPRLGDVPVPGSALKLEGNPRLDRGCPELGEHTAAVLGDLLHMDEDALAALRDEGAIG